MLGQKNLLRTMLGGACLLALMACSRTEAALTDEPSAPNEASEVKKIETKSVTDDAAQMSKPSPIKRTPSSFAVKKCMNLGNALEAENEGDWGYAIRNKDFQILARADFDTVRIPIRWDIHTSHRSPYKIKPEHMARVKQVVAQANAAGLGAIIDVHHYEKIMRRPAREEARFLAIWTQIAAAFQTAPDNVYFEILNEPTLDITMSEVNALHAKIIPLIRKTNPTRKIILGGNSWNSIETMSAVRWPQDNNIVATFHDYGPHEFTHQGAEWSEPRMPLGHKWGGVSDQEELKSTYDLANAFHQRTGIPVFVGEFGVINGVPQAQRNQWTKIRRQAMEASGFGWCAWDYAGAFDSYDPQTERWHPGVLDALFGQ